MKRSDIQLIILVAVGSAVFGLIIAHFSFGSGGHRQTSAPSAEAISSDFPSVSGDSRYKAIFNPGALDPTQLIQLGGQNGQPFGQ